MLTIIRRNAVAWLALFVSLGGSGLAASRYVITSTSQIKPSVVRSLRGTQRTQEIPSPSGVMGPTGPIGPTGPTGPSGNEIKAEKLCWAILDEMFRQERISVSPTGIGYALLRIWDEGCAPE